MKEILKNMNPLAIARGENGARRIIYTLIGVFFIGFGISVFSFANLGVDAFTSFTMGVSGKIGIGLGTVQMVINFIIIIIVSLLSKKLIGLGTIFNMVLVGYICEFFIFVYDKLLTAPENIFLKLALMLHGTLILSLGVAFYFVADLGVPPPMTRRELSLRKERKSLINGAESLQIFLSRRRRFSSPALSESELSFPLSA